ncbi:pilus assembly protein CpaE [Marinobacter daqiaonensis]|uniref:Pilus assembly protein CpaE n=1 Tax=Marinobacter daqiaonensis TaxID=650891 RepID=A0A1I6JGC1_9GAMM|nr:AAA family ATPase [Marinobacter daqiaonensis]SFR78011.1 pilus assembly protein CpaE [Marinobacter daqiaonensis]
MRYQMEILLAGCSREGLSMLESLLGARREVRVTTKVLADSGVDPLRDVSPIPDAMVLMVSENWRSELAALTDRSTTSRPPLLVIGEKDNAELIRVAMRAGARDFLSMPVAEAEIGQFIGQLQRDHRSQSSHKTARLTAVINAKGGSGASMVAANLAHILAESIQKHTVLLDMDMQFGALPLYFNLTPRNGLVRALELVDSLDLMALEGYVLNHQSGLDLMAATSEDKVTIADVPEDRVEMLLKLLGEAYEDIVVDLPRWISGATAMTLEHADHVLVVMEQGIAHLRDAQRLVSILRTELNISNSQVTVAVNRFSKSSPVSLKDISGALPDVRIVTLPNDYKRVSQSINIGSPLLESVPGASITRELVKVTRSLSGGGGQLRSAGSRWSLLSWARQA